ncbi:ATP-binding protein [Arenibacterium sp. CAU 1754]
MKKLTVRTKLLALLFALALGGALIFQYVWFPRISAILVDVENRESQRQVEIIGDSILPYLLSNQFAAIHETLSAIRDRHDNWISIALYNENGRLIYPLTKPETLGGANILNLEHNVSLRGDTLGVIRAAIDVTGPIQRVKSEQRLLAVIALGILVSSTLLIIFTIDRLLTRRLAMLGRAAKSMAVGDFETELPPMERDEIGQLTRSFAAMRDKIHHQTIGLKVARQDAENALAAKSQFLATMSHEIRTPLNGVIPVADLLLQTKLDSKQKKHAETIRESGKALLSVVNDILDLASFEEGRLVLNEEPMTMGGIGRSVKSILELNAREKGLDLVIHRGPAFSTPLIGDSRRIRQVLMNLIGNAIKFTEAGKIEMFCELLSQNEDSIELRIKVQDSGIGIEPEAQDRIFERFEQAEAGQTRRFGGSGLGLAISKSIIEAHGGEIGLTSVPGKGSTFWFTLRCRKGDEKQVVDGHDHDSGKDRRSTARFSGRALVADDNEINRLVFEGMLQTMGLDTKSVDDGAKAYQAVSREDFDIIFMDMHMPVMDGLMATRKIRAMMSSNRSRTRIVALTASVLDEDADKCREAGMDGFLTKPIAKSDLIACLNLQLASHPNFQQFEKDPQTRN